MLPTFLNLPPWIACALLLVAATPGAALDQRGTGGLVWTSKEMRVWATDLAARNRYYELGDMRASLGANNTWSPADGRRIQTQANAFRDNAALRASERYTSAPLATAHGVVIKGSGGEPHTQGKYLRDCAFLAACRRSLGDTAGAQAYAQPVIAELLAHAREPLLDFAQRSVPGRIGYRWPVQQSDYLSSGSNPSFAIAEWMNRLFYGYDYVRAQMTSADRAVMDAWFLGAARWVQVQVDRDINPRFGDGSTSRFSGTEPFFERFTDATAALTVRNDSGNQLPLYFGGPLNGSFKRYYFTNRHLTNISLVYLIGLHSGDQALIRSGEFFYKELLTYAVYPTGEHVDLSRCYADETPLWILPGETEIGFNYYLSVVGRLVLMAEWSSRTGRGLAAWGTAKGAFGTSDGQTVKNLRLVCRRALSYFSTTSNPQHYVSLTATMDPALRIDGVDPQSRPPEITYDTWIAGINLVFKDDGLRGGYQRTAAGTRPYPQFPRSIGPNQPWSGHADTQPGPLFLFGGREGIEASDYSRTSRPLGLRVGSIGTSAIALAWTNPSTIDDRYTAIELECATGGGAFAVIATFTTGNPITTAATTVTGLAPLTTYRFRLRGRSLVGTSSYSSEVAATTTAAATWTTADIGAVGATGTASQGADGAWTVSGSGADIWNTADAFRFVDQALVGDGMITARVASFAALDGWAKAGVMIRDGNGASVRHAMMAVTHTHGLAFQRRTVADGVSDHTAGPRQGAPSWIRMERRSGQVIGSVSTDGTVWSVVGNVNMELPTAVRIGLCVTSHADGTLATAVFTDVVIVQAPADAG